MASVICVGTGTAITPLITDELFSDNVILIVNVSTPGHCDHGRDIHSVVADNFMDEPVAIEPSWQKMNKGLFSKKQRRSKNGY